MQVARSAPTSLGTQLLYITDAGSYRVRRVTPPFPGFSEVGDIVIASPDGTQAYVFNDRGKHLRTLDTMVRDDDGNPVVLYELGYDTEGRLASITDRDGNVTAIEHTGNQVTIRPPPFGQSTAEKETVITLNADGYAESIQAPGTQPMQLDYTPEGLMTGLTDPDGNPSTFGYADGRLTSVLGPGSSGDSLARTEIPPGTGSNGGFEVVHTTAEGVQTSYQVEVKTTGDEQRTTVMPDGTQEVLLKGMDGTSERTASDGTIQATAEGPDPRFGMQSPVQHDVDITTPDGLAANVTSSRQVTEDAQRRRACSRRPTP